jgi:hypothetical protein
MFLLAEAIFFQCNLKQNQRKSKSKMKKDVKKHVDIKSECFTPESRTNADFTRDSLNSN